MWLARREGITALPHWKQDMSVLVEGWLGCSTGVAESVDEAMEEGGAGSMVSG